MCSSSPVDIYPLQNPCLNTLWRLWITAFQLCCYSLYCATLLVQRKIRFGKNLPPRTCCSELPVEESKQRISSQQAAYNWRFAGKSRRIALHWQILLSPRRNITMCDPRLPRMDWTFVYALGRKWSFISYLFCTENDVSGLTNTKKPTDFSRGNWQRDWLCLFDSVSDIYKVKSAFGQVPAATVFAPSSWYLHNTALGWNLAAALRKEV